MYPFLLESRLKAVSNVKTVQDFFGRQTGNYQAAFDSVAYVNVLEHIEGDGEELSHVLGTLKSGGHLLIFRACVAVSL